MKSKLHGVAGGGALVVIATFLALTLWSEIFGSRDQIAAVKTGIMFGIPILVAFLATAGASGFALARPWKVNRVEYKKRRMKIIAANGMLILLPSALFLGFRANSGVFDVWFYGVQLLEIVAGSVNLVLLIANARDGIRLVRAR